MVDKAIKNGAFIASECFRHVQHRPTHRRKTAGINTRAGYGMRVVHDFASDCGNCREAFSKLKIIKIYLRSTMSQERLDGLAIISIEHECATSTR